MFFYEFFEDSCDFFTNFIKENIAELPEKSQCVLSSCFNSWAAFCIQGQLVNCQNPAASMDQHNDFFEHLNLTFEGK